MASDDTALEADTSEDLREQELLWPARQHPDELILPHAHPTRFPGKWVAIYEGLIPADQRNALRVEGFRLSRIQLLEDGRAQVIIREEPRPDRDGDLSHPETDFRYKDYNPRAPREYLETDQSGCPNCGADPDSVKEREDGPDGIWGSHVCVACGAELYSGGDGR